MLTKSVGKGTPLDASMFELKPWPSHLMDFDAIQNEKEAIGRLPKMDLVAGEPLLSAKLRQRGERGDLEDQLGQGEAALTVRVTDIVGVPVSSILGLYVDLVLTRRDGAESLLSLPIVDGIRVLAVNDVGTADRPVPIKMLTLAVTKS